MLLDGTNTPIADAIISTTPPTSQVVADGQGRFTFNEIEAGTYTVRAEFSGFVSSVETVTVLENRESVVIINMTEKLEDNTPPTSPENIAPANGASDLDISFTLHWTATDVDADALTYDVYTFHSATGPGLLMASGITDTFLVLNNLKYGTTCFWQVVVSDGEADPVYSEVWSFATKPFPDHPFVFAKIANGKYDIFAAQNGNSAIPQYQLTELPGSNFRPASARWATRLRSSTTISSTPKST
ncbi:MAG: carboxypeptidase regulatory-like domain-containing protein [Saprospiraceae bacterium]|nr:carboxypeptidase regulatory-like domain-containing protein [Saprospiraceae bacterium]